MQQVFDTGSNSLMALRAPDITPHPRGEEEPPLMKSGRRGLPTEEIDSLGAGPETGGAPRIKVFPHADRLYLRIDHPVRDLLVSVQQDLGEFVRSNLRPHPVMGFRQPEREPVSIESLVEKLRSARERFEWHSADRSDGFGTALTIRSAAGEASVAIDHTLIDLISASNGGTLAENEIAPYLHALTNLKHGLGQLLQQFDASMLEFVQQSGMLQRMLGGGEEKGPAKSKRG